MAPHDDYFTPEQVDQQIEQLRQPPDQDNATDEARLVSTVQHFYHTPTEPQNQAFLKRARQRIVSEEDRDGSLDNTLLPVEHSPIQRNARPRRSRVIHLFQGLAAVLVVGALISGWLVVTHMMNHPHVTSISSPRDDIYIVHYNIAYRIDGSTGKEVWHHPVSTRKQSDPQMGSSASLQVVNHVVYAMLDFDIYALNADTGEEIWHVTNQTNKSYFYFVVDSKHVYLYTLDSTFSALNVSDGSLAWHNTTFHTENGYGFSVSDGILYTTLSATDPNSQPVQPSDLIYALDATTGKVRWHFLVTQGTPFAPTLVSQGMVYIFSGNILFGLSEQTGKQSWEWTPPGGAGLQDIRMIGGTLYVDTVDPASMLLMGANPDLLHIIAINPQTGKQLWISDPGYNTFNVPNAAGLLLSYRQHNGTYSVAGLDTHTGKPAWQQPFACSGHPVMEPGYASCNVLWSELINGKWYLVASDAQAQTPESTSQRTISTLKVIDPATGILQSSRQLNWENGERAIGSSNGLVYTQINIPRFENTITYSDYAFAAYRLTDGTKAWRFDLPPLPTPTSANTAPGTSQPVLAP